MMDIIDSAHNLEMSDDGIWICPESNDVSYPEDGHARNFLVEDKSFWFRYRNECIVAAVKNFYPKGAILDI